MTTFGRLAQDPDVRRRIGFNLQAGTVVLDDDESAVIRRLLTILKDLVAKKVTVTHLKKKGDRANYTDGLLRDDTHGPSRTGTSTGTDDDSGDEDDDADETPDEAPSRPHQAAHPLADIDFRSLHPRIQLIITEVRKLNPDKFPNAIAVLLRAIVELSVTEYLHRTGSTAGADKKLAERVREAMSKLNIAASDPRFQPLRTQLRDRNSIISVPNLHQYLHNVNAAPGRSDLNSIAMAYRPLLEEICTDLHARSSSSV